MANSTDHIRTYHHARVFSPVDIDEQIHTLNAITNARGSTGSWVCGRVVSNPRDGDMAIFFYLENFSELINQARQIQHSHQARSS